jgi:hypothetical protein
MRELKNILTEILTSTEDKCNLNPDIDFKRECNILSFLQQIALANQTGGKVNVFFCLYLKKGFFKNQILLFF